jgi:flagellar basal body-associated protein FliL
LMLTNSIAMLRLLLLLLLLIIIIIIIIVVVVVVIIIVIIMSGSSSESMCIDSDGVEGEEQVNEGRGYRNTTTRTTEQVEEIILRERRKICVYIELGRKERKNCTAANQSREREREEQEIDRRADRERSDRPL